MKFGQIFAEQFNKIWKIMKKSKIDMKIKTGFSETAIQNWIFNLFLEDLRIVIKIIRES